MSKENKPEHPVRHLLNFVIIPIVLAIIAILAVTAFNILKPQTYAGEIFGKKITQAEFDQVNKYNRLQNLVRYGKAFESIEPLLDLDTEAWDQLLLLKEAKNQKVKVSDKDVIDEIAQYPFFFRKDKFDSLLYRDIIRNSLKAEPKEFEESVRQNLLAERLRDKVTESVTMTDAELLAEFQKRRDLIQLEYAVIENTPFLEGITPSDEEIKTYFEANPDEFEIGESIQIEYIWLPFPPDGGVQKQVETKFKGRAIIDRHTKNNLSLKEAAESMKFELKQTAFFTRDDAPADIGINWNFERINSTFRMKKGELSQPIEEKTGYVIIKMIDKREPRTPDLKEIKDKVAAKIKTLKAQDLAVKKAEEIIAQINTKIQAGMDFKAAAAESGLAVQNNPLTQRESAIDNLGLKEESVPDLSKIQANTIGPVLHVNDGAAIVFLVKSVPVSEEAFKKTADSFRRLVLNEKKAEAFEKFMKDLRKTANLKKY